MLLKLLTLSGSLLLTRAVLAFDYFEHRAIGNAAFSMAMQKVSNPTLAQEIVVAREHLGLAVKPARASSPLQDVPLEFGDLAALAGDFSATVKDLDNLLTELRRVSDATHDLLLNQRALALIAATRREWEGACRWFYRTRPREEGAGSFGDNCFGRLVEGRINAKQLRGEEPVQHRFGSPGYKASREQQSGYEQIENYISLASRNRSHFPQFSWVSYRDHHREALGLADCFRRRARCDEVAGPALLARALLHEGFAQHFLQDSFAAGHVGTQTSHCLFLSLMCTPTLARVQQTHDVLNEIGLPVRIGVPMPHLADIGTLLHGGWTAFGDGHLFIPEADFHRAVLVRTAAASIEEVLAHASSDPTVAASCAMCTSRTFPVPSQQFGTGPGEGQPDLASSTFRPDPLISFLPEPNGLDLRSPDHRVPGIAVEGWKVGLALASENANAGAGAPTRSNRALMLKLDYIRPTDPRYPDVFGFESWNVPKRGWSYMLTTGWSWPKEVANTAVTIRAKIGWQLDDNFTTSNPSPERRRSFELVFPTVEYTYEIYRPLALFVQVNALSYSFTDRRATMAKKRGQNAAIGLRLDFAGV